MGASALPTMAIAAASLNGSPMATAIGNVNTVPNSAITAIIMHRTGAISMYPMSEITPMPMKIRTAIRPLLNVKV